MPTIKTNLWAAVMNAGHVRLVCDIKRGTDPDAPRTTPDEIVLTNETQRLTEIMSDKPGRSFSSTGGGRRSSMEYSSDPVAESTRAMLREAIGLLETHLKKGDFDRLAVCADPSTLGEWRKLVPPALAATVVREVAANHLHLSPHDLRQLLIGEIGGARS